MNRHLEFTIDFETCALTANAAPMQVAVVPWWRCSTEDPFVREDTDGHGAAEGPEPLVCYVDLRTCVVDGFDFDEGTVHWWYGRSEAAKKMVCGGLAEPVSDVLSNVLGYIRDTVAEHQPDGICLWCQGPDVDIAILRNLCRRYGASLEAVVPHASFRDCRTLILEAALREAVRGMEGRGTRANGVALPEQILADPRLAYNLYEPLPQRYARGGEAHDALYDARLSSWNAWQALRWLNE